MSRNIINTIGYHTFKYDPSNGYDESGAPCVSKVKTKEDGSEVLPFVGEGYYFWDDNIERAHLWGRQRCHGKYKIMRCPLMLQGETFLDLVGSREDIRNFSLILEKLKEHCGDLTISKAILRLQMMSRSNPEIFPFKIIRVMDVSKNKGYIKFAIDKKSQMLLNPEIFICFFEIKDIPLQSANIL